MCTKYAKLSAKRLEAGQAAQKVRDWAVHHTWKNNNQRLKKPPVFHPQSGVGLKADSASPAWRGA
jgi:hypothetical protein